MNLAVYLGLLHSSEQTLAESFRMVADGHPAEADVHHLCRRLAGQCERHVSALAPLTQEYGEEPQHEPERLQAQGLASTRSGPVGLLRDLHDLYLLAAFVDLTWTLVGQAGRAARDSRLIEVVADCEDETAVQLAWLRTRLKQAAPQALAGS